VSDHDFLRYFDGEMRWLKAAAREFAQQHPQAGQRLGVDSQSRKMNESVERLFQGFSLMMARLRRKLDDDIPELTEPLLGQLLPVVNRTLPSTAMVELTPANRQSHLAPHTLSAGTELPSLPVITPDAPQGNRCPYRTVEPLTLYPFWLARVTRHTLAQGAQALTLHFSLVAHNEPREVMLTGIPLFIAAERQLQSQLYLTLTKHVSEVRLRYGNSPESHPFTAQFLPCWQSGQPSLWPQSDSPALCGEIRPLLEYFTAPARFFRLMLDSPVPVRLPARVTDFTLTLTLSKPLCGDLTLPESVLRMHCVSVINLFRLTGEPLVTQPAVLDYRLRPHRLTDGHTEIYAVDLVEEREEEDGARHQYVPYSHFRHKGGMLKYEDQWPARFFHTRVWRGVSGLHETLLMLGGWGHGETTQRRLLLNLTCTNGAFPRMALQQALFDTDYTTGNLAIRGRTRSLPTLPCYPPSSPLYQWRLLSLLHPRALSQMLASAESLRAALALLDWTEDDDNRRRIAGILAVSTEQAFCASRRWHGVHIGITLDEAQFSSAGDAWLFCELLEQFLSQYASIIRFTQLTVTLAGSGEQWQWPARFINRALM
jgi:type VI secretion system protein ImpG